MKAEDCKLNEKYRSRVNVIAPNCRYEIIKKNKTSCWVRLWDGKIHTDTIYKNVRYGILI